MSQDQVPDDTESSSNADFEHIATMGGWSFRYNQGADDYSLFFRLLNDEEEVVSANVDVDIRIINDNGEEVFAATKSVTDDDFAYYESSVTGTQYLANIRIPTPLGHPLPPPMEAQQLRALAEEIVCLRFDSDTHFPLLYFSAAPVPWARHAKGTCLTALTFSLAF